MTTLLLHLQGGVDETDWAVRFRAALPFVQVVQHTDAFDPAAIDYVMVWKPLPDAFVGLTNLKAVLSYGAGVDALLQHPHLPDAPIARFVDPDLTARMVEYVVAQVTMHQRLHTRFRRDQTARRWAPLDPPPASAVHVGIMGLGVLGSACAAALSGLGFAVQGWSRSAKALPGLTCYGEDAFDDFLATTDILVCLLPLTPATTGILDMALFKRLRRALPGGPVVINAARGGHHIEADLAAALSDDTLGAASIDVFAPEPLPSTSPLWELDNCYITPHVAAVSSSAAGVAYFARMIIAHEAGAPLTNLIDRRQGY